MLVTSTDDDWKIHRVEDAEQMRTFHDCYSHAPSRLYMPRFMPAKRSAHARQQHDKLPTKNAFACFADCCQEYAHTSAREMDSVVGHFICRNRRKVNTEHDVSPSPASSRLF